MGRLRGLSCRECFGRILGEGRDRRWERQVRFCDEMADVTDVRWTRGRRSPPSRSAVEFREEGRARGGAGESIMLHLGRG